LRIFLLRRCSRGENEDCRQSSDCAGEPIANFCSLWLRVALGALDPKSTTKRAIRRTGKGGCATILRKCLLGSRNYFRGGRGLGFGPGFRGRGMVHR
jgi:hypothetical protein